MTPEINRIALHLMALITEQTLREGRQPVALTSQNGREVMPHLPIGAVQMALTAKLGSTVAEAQTLIFTFPR